jgi:hypothetical protein
LLAFRAVDPGQAHADITELTCLFESGFQWASAHELPLADAVRACQALENRAVTGLATPDAVNAQQWDCRIFLWT